MTATSTAPDAGTPDPNMQPAIAKIDAWARPDGDLRQAVPLAAD